MKIIIAGAGEVGSHLAEMLSNEYHNLTVIDSDEGRVEGLSESFDLVTIVGSPTSIKTLSEAGAESADLFIAVSPAHEQDINIISALLAKRMGSKRVTARINNEEYLQNENRLLFTQMGIDLLFYPEKIASIEIVNLLKERGKSLSTLFTSSTLLLTSFRLEEGSPLIGTTLSNSPVSNREDFKVMALSRDGETVIPDDNLLFRERDLLFAISKESGKRRVLDYSGGEEREIRKVMIVGGGRVAEMVAKELEGWRSIEQIKVIEIKRERCDHLNQELNRSLVINGDVRNSNLLMEEEIESFDTFIAVTSSSEINILSSLLAKKMGVAKVIAEVENLEYIKFAESMGIDAIINKKIITASKIFKFTLSGRVQSIRCLSGSNADILEFLVTPKSSILGKRVKEINFHKEALIGGVVRGGISFIANDETIIEPYDRVILSSLPSALKRVNSYFA